MQLKILAGRHVGDAVGIFLGQFRHDLHLGRIEPAEGQLDPQHAGGVPHRAGTLGGLVREWQLAAFGAVIALPVVVALAIGAAAQAGLGENLFVDLPLLAQLDLRLELVDFATDGLGQLAFEVLFPDGVAGFHENFV